MECRSILTCDLHFTTAIDGRIEVTARIPDSALVCSDRHISRLGDHDRVPNCTAILAGDLHITAALNLGSAIDGIAVSIFIGACTALTMDGHILCALNIEIAVVTITQHIARTGIIHQDVTGAGNSSVPRDKGGGGYARYLHILCAGNGQAAIYHSTVRIAQYHIHLILEIVSDLDLHLAKAAGTGQGVGIRVIGELVVADSKNVPAVFAGHFNGGSIAYRDFDAVVDPFIRFRDFLDPVSSQGHVFVHSNGDIFAGLASSLPSIKFPLRDIIRRNGLDGQFFAVFYRIGSGAIFTSSANQLGFALIGFGILQGKSMGGPFYPFSSQGHIFGHGNSDFFAGFFTVYPATKLPLAFARCNSLDVDCLALVHMIGRSAVCARCIDQLRGVRCIRVSLGIRQRERLVARIHILDSEIRVSCTIIRVLGLSALGLGAACIIAGNVTSRQIPYLHRACLNCLITVGIAKRDRTSAVIKYQLACFTPVADYAINSKSGSLNFLRIVHGQGSADGRAVSAIQRKGLTVDICTAVEDAVNAHILCAVHSQLAFNSLIYQADVIIVKVAADSHITSASNRCIIANRSISAGIGFCDGQIIDSCIQATIHGVRFTLDGDVFSTVKGYIAIKAAFKRKAIVIRHGGIT